MQKWWLLISIKLIPSRERAHVKIGTTAMSWSCKPKAHGMAGINNYIIRIIRIIIIIIKIDKCMAVSPSHLSYGKVLAKLSSPNKNLTKFKVSPRKKLEFCYIGNGLFLSSKHSGNHLQPS